MLMRSREGRYLSLRFFPTVFVRDQEIDQIRHPLPLP
jgi:hypothetical protein